MPTLHVEIEMNVSRSLVWEALCRKDQWKQWNTFLFDRTPQQTLTRGHSLILALQRLPKEPETQFQAIVTHVEADTCLKWIAIAPGYRSEHIFELFDLDGERTRYFHREKVSGVLSPLFFPFIRKDEHRGIRRMAMDLKEYVEARCF
ncbi:MAG: SRPBCC domain-containing protein [Symploca sp. SIO2B6]|nr:SRPBCC domain-containing protein [Symploca sp. SIO2B6]